MLGDLSTKIMHVQKQLRLIENNSYIMSLSSGARPSFQLLPEARNQRQRTKNIRNSSLQRRQHIKTLHPISFLKKRTRRRLGAAGYIALEFFEDKNLDPPTFASKSKRLEGYTQWVQFLRKIAPTQKELGYSMLESPSTKNQSNFRTRPSSSLFQIARGSGATPRWMNFFQKAHNTRRSKEALHGFTQESTRATLVLAQQDLEEQNKASGVQPWSARGLVDAGPMGYTTRKRGGLVWLGFLPCNPNSNITM